MAEKEACEESKSPSEFGSKLLKTRSIVIAGEIDPEVAEKVIAQLLVLDGESHDPIRVYISSNGGHVESGLAIHDVMKFINSDVYSIGTGWVVSIAVPIFFGARKENRYCLPNTRFMIHQPMGGVGGQATDVRIAAQEIIKVRERINLMIAEETGQPIEKVSLDADRNFWMTAPEAVNYGLVTKIIEKVTELP